MKLKRKLKLISLLLVITLMFSHSGFSQTDTTKVILTNTVAKLVIKDLIEGDAAKAEVVELKEIVKVQTEQIGIKNLIIGNQSEQIGNLELTVKLSDKQQAIQDEAIRDFEKALKKEKRTTFLYKLTTAAGVVASVLLLVR